MRAGDASQKASYERWPLLPAVFNEILWRKWIYSYYHNNDKNMTFILFLSILKQEKFDQT